MAKEIQIHPAAGLERHDGDEELTQQQLLDISLFKGLKRQPSFEKFPGSVLLRHYHGGDVICRQGEAGWTAFYILTTEDLRDLRQNQVQAAAPEEEKKTLAEQLAVVQQRLTQLKPEIHRDPERVAATVYLAIARPSQAKKPGLLERLQRTLFGRPAQTSPQRPLSIPIDGPTNIDYETREDVMYEGELFGEMSCLYRTPRSATVVANRDCYMIEMMRNILDQLQKEASYKARMDEIYKKRVLQSHLRQLSIFRDLTDQQFEEARQYFDRVELIPYEPGQVICDEHERSDSMYIIRSGFVKVMKNVSSLLRAEDIQDPLALATALKEGEQKQKGPGWALWRLLDDSLRQAIRAAPGPQDFPENFRDEMAQALNTLIKYRQLPDLKEIEEIIASALFKERLKELPANRKTWSELDHRRHNRLLLEMVFPQALRSLRRGAGPECVLAYRSRGEPIGEMGLMTGKPRSATCIAFSHPQGGGQKDLGRVELVRIPAQLFFKLVETSAAVRANLEKVVAGRKQEDLKRLSIAPWDENSPVHGSERFEQLGLIQGQKLMLIDLDRCTRCDECVKACANTHADGRSRLFLDGPRFGKYLVPSTCRSCLDPVCMIGCPVGSIHRGDNREIVIEDWCIGCSLCARQCPYGAIQMHAISIIPEGARGWHYLPSSAVNAADWNARKFRPRGWLSGKAPFVYSQDFQAGLRNLQVAGQSPTIFFRYDFQLGAELLDSSSQFKMEVTSLDSTVTVWMNGHPIKPNKVQRGKGDYVLLPETLLCAGKNTLAVRAAPGENVQDTLLEVSLDHVPKPALLPGAVGEFIGEVVTHRAVVCDLCSTLPGKVPACVNACPHDAALRVDARYEFPVR